MTYQHLSVEVLGQVERGEVEGKEVVRALLDHLLALCPECRRVWRQASLPTREALSSSPRERYAALFERALARARQQAPNLEQEREEAPLRVAELMATSERDLPRLLESAPRFLTWGVCDLLIQESHRAAFEDPEAAAALARLAISLSNRLSPVRYGAAFLKDVRAMAWAYYGNAHRVGSDLRQAEQALQMSEELIAEGTGDLLIRAQWLSLLGSLRKDQRRFDEAGQLLAEMTDVAVKLQDRELEARSRVQQASVLREAGRADQAVDLLAGDLAWIEDVGDGRLLLCAHHSLLTCLVDLGRGAEALAYLNRVDPLYRQQDDFSTQTRRAWLEGRLLAQLGREEEAAAALTSTRRAFLGRGIGYDAALVSLELAALHLGRGETAEVKTLAEEMLPIFRSRDVHREAMAALLMFQQAARAEQLSRELLMALTTYLRRARRDSSLRFEPLGPWP